MRTLIVIGLVFAVGCATAPDSDTEKKAQASDVQKTIEMFKKEGGGIDVYIKESYGWAVFPDIKKGGLGVGGAFGRGEVFEEGKMVGYAKLSSASVGFQIGGQEFSQIVFFQDKATLDKFKSGSYGFDANASAVAAQSGSAARAEFKDGVAVFVHADGGLMAEASVGGQKFSYEAAK